MKKVLYSSLFSAFVFVLTASIAFAHGGNSNSEYYVDPGDKNCMGQLARMHAQDEKHDTNGIPSSIAESNHPSFHDFGKDATVKQTMKAFKEYCNSEDE